jgi:hypothetical protein
MWGFWGAVASKWAKPVRSEDAPIEHREPAVNWDRLLFFVIFFAMLGLVKYGAQHVADWIVPVQR